MAREYEFRPDPEHADHLDKLLLSQRQRFGLLRWTLFSVACLAGLLAQDTMLSRLDVCGAGTDLAPCFIFMVAALQGAEPGSIFALIASIIYHFSGSAPGPYVIPMITAISVFAAIFRQACLPRGFVSILLCTAGGMLLYEMGLFAIGSFLGYLAPNRAGVMALTALLSLAAVPIAYPVLLSIGKIGGETWKE